MNCCLFSLLAKCHLLQLCLLLSFDEQCPLLMYVCIYRTPQLPFHTSFHVACVDLLMLLTSQDCGHGMRWINVPPSNTYCTSPLGPDIPSMRVSQIAFASAGLLGCLSIREVLNGAGGWLHNSYLKTVSSKFLDAFEAMISCWRSNSGTTYTSSLSIFTEHLVQVSQPGIYFEAAIVCLHSHNPAALTPLSIFLKLWSDERRFLVLK